MSKKSILEQALLQVQTLEEAVKANAKGILASTMKEELNNLLQEQEDIDPEEEEQDVTGAPDDVETSDNEIDADDTPEEGGLSAVDDEPVEDDLEIPAEDEDEEDVLDMTGASEDEVLKVFKAMKPEDGIVVKREGDTVRFEDEGNEYIIKLDDEEVETPEETPELEDDEIVPDELSEQYDTNEVSDQDEVVYEIELDDEEMEIEATEGENAPFEQKVGKKTETKEGVSVHKSHTTKDGQPFTKSSPQSGVKKLEAKEEATIGGAKRPGNAPQGSSNPTEGCDECGSMKEIEATEAVRTKWNAHGNRAAEPRTGIKGKKVHYAGSKVKEPGKGGGHVTQAKPFGPTAIKGTKPAEKKEPGKGGNNPEQVESRPGTPPKGSGLKPIVKEPKEAESRDINEEVKTLKKQNVEYKKALVLFKDKLNEVAVFNANLAYATRLFTEHSTTKQEKLEILKRFDTVSNITESKNLYSSIKTELETKKPISEAAVEKIASTPTSSSGEMLSESKVYENPQFRRMKELMKKL